MPCGILVSLPLLDDGGDDALWYTCVIATLDDGG